MFELLVPAEQAQLERSSGDKKAYDLELRPGLMVQAIHELQDAGIEADVWKIEGLDRREDCERIVGRGAARRAGHSVGCIVLGRGEDDKKVREWLATAAAVPGFIGFAVGRTTFWDPLRRLAGRARSTREAAVSRDRPPVPGVGGHLRESPRRLTGGNSMTGRSQAFSRPRPDRGRGMPGRGGRSAAPARADAQSGCLAARSGREDRDSSIEM